MGRKPSRRRKVPHIFARQMCKRDRPTISEVAHPLSRCGSFDDQTSSKLKAAIIGHEKISLRTSERDDRSQPVIDRNAIISKSMQPAINSQIRKGVDASSVAERFEALNLKSRQSETFDRSAPVIEKNLVLKPDPRPALRRHIQQVATASTVAAKFEQLNREAMESKNVL